MLPVTRDLRRLDTVFTKLSSLGRLLLIHVFKLQVLVLVDEIYKPERSILRCRQVCINQLHVSIFSLFTDPAQGGSGGGRRNIYFSRSALVLARSLRSDYFLFTKQRNAESSIFTFYVVVKMPAE